MMVAKLMLSLGWLPSMSFIMLFGDMLLCFMHSGQANFSQIAQFDFIATSAGIHELQTINKNSHPENTYFYFLYYNRFSKPFNKENYKLVTITNRT